MNKTKIAHIEFDNNITIILTRLWREKDDSNLGSVAHFIVIFELYSKGYRVYQKIINPIDFMATLFIDIDFMATLFIDHKDLVSTEGNEDFKLEIKKDKLKFYNKEYTTKEWSLEVELNVKQKESLIYFLGNFIGMKKKSISNKLQKNILLTEKTK